MSKNRIIGQLLGEKGNQVFEQKLKMFSVSDADAQLRRDAYSAVMEQTLAFEEKILGKDRRRAFAASVTSANLSGVSIYAGVMKSYVNSIAPIFCVERQMDTVQQQLMYIDFYEVLSGQAISPNIGADSAWQRQMDRKVETVTPGTPQSLVYGDPIVPKSFYAEVRKGDVVKGTIQDNGQGKFLATPGLITDASTIVYNNNGAATINFTWAVGLDADKLVYAVNHDVSAKDEVKKAYGKHGYYSMVADPLLIPVERNIIADHAISKQGVLNSDELYANFVENEYTKEINRKVFDSLIFNYTGNTYHLDLSSFTLAAGRWDTITRTFLNALAQGENLIAEQTYKGAKVTGILAAPDTIQVFDLLNTDLGWIKNVDSTYFQDIAGWLNGTPVVRCASLPAGEIMLTHRTADGQIAPAFHGIFLAPTEMPVVANFKNMTNYATGMYSMEGVGYTSSKLCVKLKITLPGDLTLVKLT